MGAMEEWAQLGSNVHSNDPESQTQWDQMPEDLADLLSFLRE